MEGLGTFLQYLGNAGLTLGSKIKITEQHDFDRSMTVKINTNKPIHISFEVAKNILMK